MRAYLFRMLTQPIDLLLGRRATNLPRCHSDTLGWPANELAGLLLAEEHSRAGLRVVSLTLISLATDHGGLVAGLALAGARLRRWNASAATTSVALEAKLAYFTHTHTHSGAWPFTWPSGVDSQIIVASTVCWNAPGSHKWRRH